MKKYFWSGNTNMKNGCNQQRWGILNVADDKDPYELLDELRIEIVKSSDADTFCFVAFNLI